MKNLEKKRQRRINVPVTGLPIQKKIAAMRLVFVEVQSPDTPVILDEKFDGRIIGAARTGGEEVPHLAR